MASEATPISHGAIRSNVSDGVSRSSVAPAAPPSTPASASGRSRAACPSSSGREPSTEPSVLNTSAVVLVTFAAIGPRPTASSAG